MCYSIGHLPQPHIRMLDDLPAVIYACDDEKGSTVSNETLENQELGDVLILEMEPTTLSTTPLQRQKAVGSFPPSGVSSDCPLGNMYSKGRRL